VELLGGSTDVELVYDPTERLIGIKPSPKSATSFPLQGSDASTRRISAKTLVKAMNIDASEAKHYDAEFKDGYLVVDLRSGRPASPGAPRLSPT
jgi:hypothetical protein